MSERESRGSKHKDAGSVITRAMLARRTTSLSQPAVRSLICSFAALACLFSSKSALSHSSDQAFVLLLPTKVYITAGVIAVVLTIVLLALLPSSTSQHIFSVRKVIRIKPYANLRLVTSLLSLAVIVTLVVVGIIGSRDPLKNPLPLYIWTFWWIGLLGLQGFVGNIWYWLNPWVGLCKLLGVKASTVAGERLNSFGSWPAIVLFLLFTMFALAYPSPDDPDKLAIVVVTYYLTTLSAMYVFGEVVWSRCGEFVGIVMNFFAQMSPIGVRNDRVQIGLPGNRAYHHYNSENSFSLAVFVLILLGCGSFDGLNETFWWLAKIGVNPLEFPGRSAIVGQTIAGILIANLLIVLLFFICVYLGLVLVRFSASFKGDRDFHSADTRRSFIQLSISILPIAFAYHLAHFMVTFLINMQYLLAASSDPLTAGADLLGIGAFYVTTGFLNTHHSVEFLWLLQAGIVVFGHIVSLILSHGIAVKIFGSTRYTTISQIPLAAFMIIYTWLGLWLLASPKGA